MEPQLKPETPRNSLSMFRVSKLRQLEQNNLELLERIKQLEKICTTLQNENKNLKIMLQCNKNNEEKSNVQDSYHTDEEELSRETDWIVQKKRPNKKRKATKSPTVENSTKEKSKTSERSENKNKTKVPNNEPPPIMAVGVENFSDFRNFLNSNSNQNPLIRLLNGNTIKVNTSSIEDYRTITKELSKKCIPWYSYENKQTRPIKVMIKNLHHSCDANEILSDIKNQGLNVISVTQKLKWKSMEPLDMFLVSFDSTEDINKIYSLNVVLNSIIKVEPVKHSKLIPQCKNCQGYEHTKNFCNRLPRCVKCAGDHRTIECQKLVETNPVCCNCGMAHPANYRGCEVAKQLQKKRQEILKRKKQEQEPNNYSNSLRSKTLSYANAVKSNENNQTNQVMEMLKSLAQRLENLENKLCN